MNDYVFATCMDKDFTIILRIAEILRHDTIKTRYGSISFLDNINIAALSNLNKTVSVKNAYGNFKHGVLNIINNMLCSYAQNPNSWVLCQIYKVAALMTNTSLFKRDCCIYKTLAAFTKEFNGLATLYDKFAAETSFFENFHAGSYLLFGAMNELAITIQRRLPTNK